MNKDIKKIEKLREMSNGSKRAMIGWILLKHLPDIQVPEMERIGDDMETLLQESEDKLKHDHEILVNTIIDTKNREIKEAVEGFGSYYQVDPSAVNEYLNSIGKEGK